MARMADIEIDKTITGYRAHAKTVHGELIMRKRLCIHKVSCNKYGNPMMIRLDAHDVNDLIEYTRGKGHAITVTNNWNTKY